MAFGLAVYASPCGLPRCDARLASSRWSDATGRASTRRVPTKGFRVFPLHLILLPQALLGAIPSTSARKSKCPARGDRHSDAVSGVTSGPVLAKSALKLPHRTRL